MTLFRETWILIFLGLYFATTLTFADDDYDYEESGDGSGEYFSFLFCVPVFQMLQHTIKKSLLHFLFSQMIDFKEKHNTTLLHTFWNKTVRKSYFCLN